MHIVNMDIFEADADVIVHQVNCVGAMNSGVAKQVRMKYPMVFTKYKELCDAIDVKSTLLGTVLFVNCGDIIIANMFAQHHFGYNGCQFTDYNAFKSCLQHINHEMAGKKVAIPYNIGCCRGGGDWQIVSEMIETELKDCNVVIYKCDKG